jgi:osmotically-inducible protein OsmY
MTRTTMSDTVSAADLRMREAVLQELDWDSQFDAAAVGVSARDGAVTLTGSIDTYASKLAAERAARRVRGVRAVANDIQVRLRQTRGDEEIARDAAHELARRPTLPTSVQATVRSGTITLTGTVLTLFQKAIAENAMAHITGVSHVVNRLQVAVGTPPHVERRVAQAIRRNGEVTSRGVQATVSGDTVTLTGTVPTWRARDAAETAAMHAPGISTITNELEVTAEPDNVDDELC